LRTAKQVQGADGKLMVCHANGVVKEVMELSGFESFLQMHETEEDALAAF
jgi:anti-anti-sigma regulatory factor